MLYNTIPGTQIEVSRICLGTMTWGEQNNESQGHSQMDLALEKGVNFFDTAEMYPVPASDETQGKTEEIIGSWFRKSGKRDEIILASKIAGPGRSMKHIRPNLGFSREALEDAINKSLSRLKTDYIDLYQLHWPERSSNFFGIRDYEHEEEEWVDNFSEVLDNLQSFIKAGKIREIGLSNETPFGVMRFIEESKKGRSMIRTVQNPYNLLNRKDEIGLTEIYHREKVGLLPYSPLGMGTLSGKYLKNLPANSRLALFPQYSRYSNAQAVKATEKYCDLAARYDLDPAQMALAFVINRPFVTSTIIGATNLDQLARNLDSINLKLSEEIIDGINEIHNEIPNPAP